MNEPQWPPKNGREYIHSEEFGNLVVSEARKVGEAHPTLDLADSVATTFQWFNTTLNANRNFISKKRFPTVGSFRAYIRQMVYNAGMRAFRIRKKRQDLSSVPESDMVIDSPSASAERKEELLNFVERLEEPHKTVFTRYFFDEDQFYLIAVSTNCTEDEAQKIYEEAVDQIGRFFK